MNTLPPASSTPSPLKSALHESRRRDAARVISRYRHLVADGAERELSAPLVATASAGAGPAANHGKIRMFGKLNANLVMAAVLVVFGMAHVFGVVMIQRAATPYERHAAMLPQGD